MSASNFFSRKKEFIKIKKINPVLGIPLSNKTCAYLRGLQIGNLIVNSFSHRKEKKTGADIYWNCTCICGKKTKVRSTWLLNCKTTSCGCINYKKISQKLSKDILGKKSYSLTVIKKLNQILDTSHAWLCQCDCGNTRILSTRDFNSGNYRHCSRNCPKKVINSLLNKKYNQYKNNAKSLKREFNIDIDKFKDLVKKNCFYCGYLDHFNGLDRRNNKKGYTLNNVVPYCKVCNQAKSSMKYSYFMNWVKRLTKFQLEKQKI